MSSTVGAGNDVLWSSEGADTFIGGAGARDGVDYRSGETRAVTVTVGSGQDDGVAVSGGASEGDDVRGDVEKVAGGMGDDDLSASVDGVELAGREGDDALSGDDGADVIYGDAGNDAITGGDGADRVSGGADADTIHVDGDGANVDVVDCGSELDTTFADPADTLDASCERTAPVAFDDALGVGEDTGDAAVDLVGNDTDQEGDDLYVASVDDAGTSGVVTVTNGHVSYDPDGQFEALAEGATTTDTFTYKAGDGSLESNTATVTVTITGVNDAPVLTRNTAEELAYTENDPSTPLFPALTIADPDTGAAVGAAVVSFDPATFELGEDEASLPDAATLSPATSITATRSTDKDVVTLTGAGTHAEYAAAIRTIGYRNTSDDPAGADRTAQVTVSDDLGLVSDAVDRIVNLTGANDTPTRLTLDDRSIPENSGSGATVGELSTTDADDTSHTYTLDDLNSYPDNAAFAIDGATLKTVANFDYETQAAYDIHVRSTDGDDEWIAVSFTITITDVNEAPTDIGLADTSVAENTTAVDTATTTDPDAGDTHEYAIVGGADQSLLSIDTASGALAFNTAPNYEAPADADANNRYDVRLRTTDAGGESFDETFGIEVTNVNEAPYALTLDDLSVAENGPAGTKVATASAEDPDNDALTYSLATGTGDDDNGTFTFDGEPTWRPPSRTSTTRTRPTPTATAPT